MSSNSGQTDRPLFEARRISKSFLGVQALHGVDLVCSAGAVHGLVGANGAGKSTFVSIITGAAQVGAGEMFLDGTPYRPRNPRDALGLGVAAVYQEFTLLRNMSVQDNILLGQEVTGRSRLVDRREERRLAEEILQELGVEGLDVRTEAARLSVASLQLVEIARALLHKARLLVLDEPSAVLAGRELERLFEVVHRLVGRGVGVLFISHRLSEVASICDDVTVLRDGRVVSSGRADDYTVDRMVHEMVGQRLTKVDVTATQSAVGDEVVLEVSGLRLRGGGAKGLDLRVHSGEIVGLAGLMGSGRSRILRTIAGIEPSRGGKVVVRGRALRRNSIRSAVRNGIGLIPEERKTEGILLDLSLTSNVSLVALGRVARLGFLDRRREDGLVGRVIARLRLPSAAKGRTVRTLSGGNQQKVVLAKWLAVEPAVLLLDEPTRGIDVGAKEEIYKIIRELAERGMATVIVSSDLPELLALTHRLLVVNGGQVVGEIASNEASEESLVSMAVAGHQDVVTPLGIVAVRP